MSITKTKNGTYRLRIYVPEEVKSSLGINKKVIEKRFKLRSEAKKYELELQNKIDKILSGESTSLETNGSILFSDFYHNVWWESYKAGQTTSTQNHLHKLLLTVPKLSLENISYPCLVIIPLIFSIKINRLS
jgi:phage integrase family integrase/recombinase